MKSHDLKHPLIIEDLMQKEITDKISGFNKK
jgi:hypothetical protein